MLTVHVRINDAATGKPTPVRLCITGSDGRYYPPLGRLADFAVGRNEDVGGNLLLLGRAWSVIDGTCEVPLPPGPLSVEISKGFEYLPQKTEVVLGPGKMALRFQVERWTDLRAEGWYSGDARAHFLTPHAALLEAAAEDVGVVNLLATETTVGNHPAIPNLLAFSGQQPALETAGHMVVVNTLNTHPVLGRLALLNCHRVVYPLHLGGPDGSDDWPLAAWCDQCHRKGGLVVWTRAASGEAAADLLLGKVDAFEIDFVDDAAFDRLPSWYRLLNCGLAVPLVGASGKDSNLEALGMMRTYANLPAGEPLTYKGWIEAVRAGRTFMTSGPLMTFDVMGQGPGAKVPLAAERTHVPVRATARSVVPFERLELLRNGEVVAEAAASGSPVQSATIELEMPISASGWVAARCRDGQRVVAHTSPVYLAAEGRPVYRDLAAVQELLRHLDEMLDWVRREARCSTEAKREAVASVFVTARQALLRP